MGEQLLKEYAGMDSPLREYHYAEDNLISSKMFGYHGRKPWGNDETIRTRGAI